LIGRIGDRATFAGFARGRRASYGPIRVRFVTIPEGMAGTGPRVAYALNRKVGTAVVRNRVRRRLRAALADLDRSEPGRLPGGSYLFSADATVVALPYAELQRFVAGAVDRVTGRG
jgi:ribonuclease P protein component